MAEDSAKKSYGKIAKRGIVWSVLREGARSFLFLPTSMALARLLSPEEAGVAAAASFFTQLAGRFTLVGFGQSLVRLKEVREDHYSSVFVMSLAFGVAAWAVLFLGADVAGQIFRSEGISDVLPIAGLEFILVAFGAVPSAILSREMRFKEGVTSETLAWTVECVLSVFLAWQGFSYWSIVYGGLAGDLVRIVGRALLTKWYPRVTFTRAAAREVFSFGLGLYAKNILEYCSQNLDNLIVGRLLGITALGYYDKAFSAMTRLTTRMNLGGPGVSFRVFALIHEDLERFRRGYRKVILSATLVSYPGVTGLILVAPELIQVLFGSRWAAAVVPFQILCGAGLLRILNSYASTATQAMGMAWAEAVRHALFVAVLAASVYVFAAWGISGAAFGVLVATLVMTVLLQSLIKTLTGFRWVDLLAPQVPAIVSSAGLLGLLLVARGVVERSGVALPALAALAIYGAVGVAYFAAFLLFAPFASVRELVYDTMKDMAPRLAARLAFLEPSRVEARS